MNPFWNLQRYPGTILIALAAALLGGISQSTVTGPFLFVLGCWVLFGSLTSKPPRAVFFVWGAWLWGCLGLIPWQGASSDAGRLPIYQFGISMESLVLFLAMLVFFTWWLGNPVGEQVRLKTLRFYGIAVAFFGLVALIAKVQRWPAPFLDPTADYGFFPNRNHMSNWLALGGIASAVAALADARKKQWPWVICSFLAAAGVMTCLAANTSRGGLIIFFLGLLVWSSLLAWAGPDRRLGIILLILIVLAATSLLFVGARPLERMRDVSALRTEAGEQQQNSSEKNITLDFRLLAAQDCLTAVGKHPFLGLGPGNFRYAFQEFRTHTHLVQAMMVHPESDFWWFGVEYGLPALLLLLTGLAGLFARSGPGKNREGWITRAGCVSAVVAFLLHGLVDVPGHRPGALMGALLFGGLAFARKRNVDLCPASRPDQWFLRGAGALVLLAGSVWTCGIWQKLAWPASHAAERAKNEIIRGWQMADPLQALKSSEVGLRSVPLDSALLFLRGKTMLMFEEMEDQAAIQFARQANLMPYSLYIRLDQGFAWAEWAPHRPERAWEAYRGALMVAEKFPPEARATQTVLDAFAEACRLAPGLRPLAIGLWQSRPPLYAQWLSLAPTEEFLPALAALQAADPDLAGWDLQARQTLFLAWARKGDRNELAKELEERDSWREAGWPILAQIYVQQGKKQEAVNLILKHLPVPALPGRDFSGLEAERRWYRSPRDASAAFVLAETRRESGDAIGARVVLEKMTERPEVPAYFWWLRAQVEASEARWDMALGSLQKFIERSVPEWPRL